MSRLTRKTFALFGGSAGAVSGGIGEFGSAAAASPTFSIDPAVIQSLAAWAQGWNAAVLGSSKFPALEDMNGVQFVQSYLGNYLMQEGIPEYDAGTTYYQHSIVKSPGTYQLFGSLTNANIGNALTDPTNWKLLIDLGLGAGSVYIGGTSTGAANAQAVVTAQGNFANTAGNIGTFKAGFSNTASATLAYDGAAALTLKKRATTGLVNLVANDIVIGEEYMTICDGTTHQLLDPAFNPAAFLAVNNNLSDLASLATALTNLGFDVGHITTSAGYYKFPGGLIIQWSKATTNGFVAFPITFPNNFLGIAGIAENNAGAGGFLRLDAAPTTSGWTAGTGATGWDNGYVIALGN